MTGTAIDAPIGSARDTTADTITGAGTPMSLFITAVGPATLAFAAAHIAAVATWPPGLGDILTPDGVWGQLNARGAGPAIPVVDPVRALCHGGPQPAVGGANRPQPAYLLHVVGGRLALAVDRYVFDTRPVYPAPAILRGRGVYALTPTGDGVSLVLDLSRLLTPWNDRPVGAVGPVGPVGPDTGTRHAAGGPLAASYPYPYTVAP